MKLSYYTSVLFIVIVAALLINVPRPTHIELTMPGAEVDLDGSVIETGELVLEGWYYNYLFKTDEFKLEHLQLPNREVGGILEQTYPVTETVLGLLRTWALVELPEYNSPMREYTCSIYFPADKSYWALESAGRIFIVSENPDADYTAILEQIRILVD